MTLGEKLFRRRTELGLSQSEVADSQITRNMLSRLEHDQASPSVKTLSHLAEKLGVSVSWLLEDGPMMPDSQLTEQARAKFLQNDHNAVLQILWNSDVLSEEGCLLLYRSAVICAHRCLVLGKATDARRLLNRIEKLDGSYITERDRISVKRMLVTCAFADKACVDEAMVLFLEDDLAEADCQERDLLRIEQCLLHERCEEAERLLNRLSNRDCAAVWYLRGRLAWICGDMEMAAGFLEQAIWSGDLYAYQKEELCKLLEQYYRDREDYKCAYQYASMRMEILEK